MNIGSKARALLDDRAQLCATGIAPAVKRSDAGDGIDIHVACCSRGVQLSL
jgi:hypothetical protein